MVEILVASRRANNSGGDNICLRTHRQNALQFSQLSMDKARLYRPNWPDNDVSEKTRAVANSPEPYPYWRCEIRQTLVRLSHSVANLYDYLLLGQIEGGEWIVVRDPGPTVLFTEEIER